METRTLSRYSQYVPFEVPDVPSATSLQEILLALFMPGIAVLCSLSILSYEPVSSFTWKLSTKVPLVLPLEMPSRLSFQPTCTVAPSFGAEPSPPSSLFIE